MGGEIMKRLIVMLFLVSAGLAAQQKNPFASDPQAADTGRGMFRIYCSPCHGIKAQGGRGPDLTLGVFSAGDQDSDLYRVIAQGVGGTEMNGYEDSVGEDNIWRLVSYIRSISQHTSIPASGDPAAGQKLFSDKGRCAQCHRVDNKGGRLGPDLTRVGRQRSLAYLRESIVSPNADLMPDYATLRVVTRDGKEIVGVQKGIDNFSAQLMDAAENFHSFQRSEVSDIRREFRSLMPDDYGRLFTPAELNDLVAYLSRLRGTEKNQ
jgi:putative heme-binding domain-containing protein